jgi:L-asparaginase/Glu-tRNA(Gln) amidotransferase subunit D
MKKKILLIHSGGTIGMTRDSRSGVLRPDAFYASLLEVIPELSAIADIEVEIPFVLDSAELNFRHWRQLAAIIKARLPGIHGVVITHGTIPLQTGDLPQRVARWLEEGKLVVLDSEAHGGRIEPRLYESGSRLLDMGVISAGDMTFEAAATKLMFLLGQYDQPGLIGSHFQKSLAGELTVLQ